MKLKLAIMSLISCIPFGANAQIDKEMEEFDAFVRQQQKEFDDFVTEQNREFAKFLKETWKEYDLQKPVKRPQKPEPVKPVNFDKTKPTGKPQEIKVGTITRLPIPEVTPSATFPVSPEKQSVPVIKDNQKPVIKDFPVPGEKEQVKPARTGIEFSFYGEKCIVDGSLKNKLHLKGITEKNISEGWEFLSRSSYQSLVAGCLSIKEENHLNDYGFLLLTKQVATELCGRNSLDEVTLMQMFVLCQLGYKVKIVRIENHLGLFYASDNMIYATPYLTLNGIKYFKFDTTGNNSNSIYTYNRDFANADNKIRMNLGQSQLFAGTSIKKTLQSKAYPSIKVESEVNSELISFYKNYPQCDFSVYVGAPVSKEIQQTVLPPLQNAIQGKTQAEAANMLINFVQTAFAYKTDGDQFGYEKPFFVDELFYYPYSDCEDRAVLFSYLVRTLMRLDVVLLEYPNHMATAIHFNENVNGDYVMVEGAKYIICDPTYIGASIGHAMPQFKSIVGKVLKY